MSCGTKNQHSLVLSDQGLERSCRTSKYADSKSSVFLRGTWLKTKKYQTVISISIFTYIGQVFL